MRKKNSFIILLFFAVAFSNRLNAQCIYGVLDVPTIAAETKVIIVEISHNDANKEKLKFIEGKTVTVGTGLLTFTFACWYRGVVEYDGATYELAGARVKTTDENAGKISTTSSSDFPIGTNVKVFDMPNPSAFSDEPVSEFGFVVGADLVKDAGGKYEGCIEDDFGHKVCFTGKKVEITNK